MEDKYVDGFANLWTCACRMCEVGRDNG